MTESEDIFRQFENLRNTNKEMMMFFSVLSNMFLSAEENSIKKMKNQEDRLIANVLVDYKDREDMQLFKEQAVINDYVRNQY